jgi:hypothetical protein
MANGRHRWRREALFTPNAGLSIPFRTLGTQFLVNGYVTVAEETTCVSVTIMALIFQVDNESHVRAKVQCDQCGGIIENYADGVAVVDTPEAKPGTILEPVFHCNGCEKNASKTSPSRHAMPIDHFMLYVLNNIQLTPHALEDAGQRLKSTSFL